jgi:hypothetical protein
MTKMKVAAAAIVAVVAMHGLEQQRPGVFFYSIDRHCTETHLRSARLPARAPAAINDEQ